MVVAVVAVVGVNERNVRREKEMISRRKTDESRYAPKPTCSKCQVKTELTVTG